MLPACYHNDTCFCCFKRSSLSYVAGIAVALKFIDTECKKDMVSKLFNSFLQIDVFTIEAVSLEKINKILIGHDNKGDSEYSVWPWDIFHVMKGPFFKGDFLLLSRQILINFLLESVTVSSYKFDKNKLPFSLTTLISAVRSYFQISHMRLDYFAYFWKIFKEILKCNWLDFQDILRFNDISLIILSHSSWLVSWKSSDKRHWIRCRVLISMQKVWRINFTVLSTFLI